MKVIEQGPGWFYETRCTGNGNGGGGCNSLLHVEKNDIYTTSRTFIDGSTDYYYTFRCPVCHQETDIKESDVPASIRSMARTRTRGY